MEKAAAIIREFLLPLAQLASTVFAFLATRAALKAVKLSKTALEEQRESRKLEREFRRPYLTLAATGVSKPLEGPNRIVIEFKNSGINPATEIDLEIHLLSDTMTETTSTLVCRADDLSAGPSMNITTPVNLPSNKFPCHVALAARYRDGITAEVFRQDFFLKWASFPDTVLQNARRYEKQRMLDTLVTFGEFSDKNSNDLP